MTTATSFDCLVFSGGGAKGAYGAGAAKALAAFYGLKNVDRSICYLGASAGALNAAVLATSDAERLVNFWREADDRSVLGVRIKSTKYQGAKRWIGRFGRGGQFAVYSGSALLQFIERSVTFDDLKDRHLIIAATDYTEGSLKAFYHSDLVSRFLDLDRTLEFRERRLQHFLPLTKENLARALLASSSIPVFFPPVKIDSSLYVDGGLGNNTPTREAAYFFRYLTNLGLGEAGDVYVVRLEPPRVRRAAEMKDGLLDVVDRSLTIYHHVHTNPILRGWNRINDEVRWLEERLERFSTWIRNQELPAEVKESICDRARSELGTLGGATARLDVPIHVIEPSMELGDTLGFDRESVERNLSIGYQDALQVLHLAGKIDQAEREALLNRPI